MKLFIEWLVDCTIVGANIGGCFTNPHNYVMALAMIAMILILSINRAPIIVIADKISGD